MAPRRKATGDGELETPNAKKAKISTLTPGKQDKQTRVKLAAQDAAAVDVKNARKELNQHVKTMAQTVDDDWHDSYEETSEMLQEWLADCATRVSGVLRVGVALSLEFQKCHEILKVVVDTWANIKAIPFRGDPADDLSAGEGSEITVPLGGQQDILTNLTSVEDLAEFAWPLLLAKACLDPMNTDVSLLRMIKDAFDHGVQKPHEASEPERMEQILSETHRADIEQGRFRLDFRMEFIAHHCEGPPHASMHRSSV